MKRHDQLEAKVAFGITVLLQLGALLVPSYADMGLLQGWWEAVQVAVSRPTPPLMITLLFFLCGNVLWLVSPFLTRVYSRVAPLRILGLVMSIVTSAAAGLWLVVTDSGKICLSVIVLAAIIHTLGMILIRKESPELE